MKSLKINMEGFVDGIFALKTRRFGTVAEIMIKKLYQFEWSGKKSFDLYDKRNNLRIEVKFSRVAKKHREKINEENVITQCMADAVLENRFLNSYEVVDFLFDSNIQQIKCRKFDFLFYGLFFRDYVEIYGIPSGEVHRIPGYSDYQHEGNVGEGQFHLNNSSIDFHRRNCLQKRLSYQELYDLLCS